MAKETQKADLHGKQDLFFQISLGFSKDAWYPNKAKKSFYFP